MEHVSRTPHKSHIFFSRNFVTPVSLKVPSGVFYCTTPQILLSKFANLAIFCPLFFCLPFPPPTPISFLPFCLRVWCVVSLCVLDSRIKDGIQKVGKTFFFPHPIFPERAGKRKCHHQHHHRRKEKSFFFRSKTKWEKRIFFFSLLPSYTVLSLSLFFFFFLYSCLLSSFTNTFFFLPSTGLFLFWYHFFSFLPPLAFAVPFRCLSIFFYKKKTRMILGKEDYF